MVYEISRDILKCSGIREIHMPMILFIRGSFLKCYGEVSKSGAVSLILSGIQENADPV